MSVEPWVADGEYRQGAVDLLGILAYGALAAFERLAREFSEEEVSFAAVYVGGVPGSDHDAPYNVIQDSTGELTAMYNVKRVPRLFLIDDGEVVLAQDAYYEANEGEIRYELNEILQEEQQR